MGHRLCLSSSATLEHQLNEQLQRDQQRDLMVRKLLILGSKHSGKSTIFNQIQYIHNNGFREIEHLEAKQFISEYIIESMQNLIECIDEHEKYKQYPVTKFTLNEEAKRSAEFIQSLSIKQKINDSIACHIELLCEQDIIQHIVANADKYYIDSSCQYFLDNVSKYKSSEYMPSDEDIIHLRIKCDGLNEARVQMGPDSFICYDLNYKPDTCNINKIINCFENVTAIIFVASLSCFDEPVFEDEKCYRKTVEWEKSLSSMERVVGDDILSVVLSFVGHPHNAMHQALDTFEEVCSSPWFQGVPVLLMMSKSDVFASKVHTLADDQNKDDIHAFNVCFPEFEGKCNYDRCSDHIIKQFKKRNKAGNSRRLYTHLIDANDSTMVRTIFYDVQAIVIDDSLNKAGLQ